MRDLVFADVHGWRAANLLAGRDAAGSAWCVVRTLRLDLRVGCALRTVYLGSALTTAREPPRVSRRLFGLSHAAIAA